MLILKGRARPSSIWKVISLPQTTSYWGGFTGDLEGEFNFRYCANSTRVYPNILPLEKDIP